MKRIFTIAMLCLAVVVANGQFSVPQQFINDFVYRKPLITADTLRQTDTLGWSKVGLIPYPAPGQTTVYNDTATAKIWIQTSDTTFKIIEGFEVTTHFLSRDQWWGRLTESISKDYLYSSKSRIQIPILKAQPLEYRISSKPI